MYDLAKKGREALKQKARRLAGGDYRKTDSSDWSPPEKLKADVKTGMRPISRRAFKSGGKVEGECAPTHAGKKPRKAGGSVKSEASEWMKAKINRDVKKANEEREGEKHVGGMKTGGRTGKLSGGALARYVKKASTQLGDKAARTIKATEQFNKSGKDFDLAKARDEERKYSNRMEGIDRAASKLADKAEDKETERKYGGRTKRQYGGPNLNDLVPEDVRRRLGPAARTPPEMPKNPPLPPRRPVEYVGGPDTEPVGLDRDQIERMERGYKKGGKAKKAGGGYVPHDTKAGKPEIPGMKKGGRAKKMGGGMLAGLAGGLVPGLAAGAMGKDDKEPMKKGGRAGRKAGGRVGKGKTNINIVINTKPAGDQPDAMGPGAMRAPAGMRPPGGVPIPVPMPGLGAGPMPMPPGGPSMPPGGPSMPPGGIPMGDPSMPMARRRGGKVYKSYKNMDAGAGSGVGRLEKTEIASRK